ncbi:MAG: hypothetical protein Q8867_03570 [Bacteroidota bacterium]|nr:hypothetical protein [Bacteroidota bacterium]
MSGKRTYILPLISILLVFLVGLSACSTKKNTLSRRVYHNLTAHYNVYWNGMDNLRTAVREYDANVKDNYSMVLPVYNFGDKSSSGKMGQYADVSIKKATKTIQKHSMIFNRREYVRWIKHAYMLIGKGYFYKMDYPMARRTFEFVIKTYNTSDLKYEAMIWLALSNMEINDFTRAEPMLNMVQNKIRQGEAPQKYEGMLDQTYANFFLLQKNYQPALEYLNLAMDQNPNRRMKTRLMFIKAQIHQKNGENELASRLYKQVISRNPAFEMEFNAKINLAECFVATSGDKDYIISKLKKMIRDDKNKDYLDQVYFALANVYIKEKDTISGVMYLQKSVAASRLNNYQKAVSSLTLADIYFIRKDYPNAQSYYDSTMQFLPKEYPDYKAIKNRTATLTDLVTNLQIIEKEDSLQRLAKMPENQRNQIIDKIITKLSEEEMKKQQEEAERQENLTLFNDTRNSTGTGTGSGSSVGSWYFYNPSALSSGYSTFQKKYGRRKQEDLWFLSDKVLTTFGTETPSDTTATSSDTTTGGSKKASAKVQNPHDRQYYIQNLPTTPKQIEDGNNKMIKSYYNLGFIYIEGLNDYPHSIYSFETLLDRFPNNKFRAPSCYELQKLYKDLDNQPKSDYYRNILLNEFPESDFARLMINPDYYKNSKSQKKDADKLYSDTYEAFTHEQYYIVLNNCEQAQLKYPKDSILAPRFAYLKALSTGKIEVVDSMVVALQNLIMKYPKSEVRPLAQNILTYLGTQRNSQGQRIGKGTDTIPEETGPVLYTFTPNSVHFYVLIINNDKTDVNALKIKISDFNNKFFDLDNLEVSSLLLEGNKEMITVSSFPDKDKAMRYYSTIRESQYIFTRLENEGGYDDFLISTENYPVFYKNKKTDLYQRFFKKNYPIEK